MVIMLGANLDMSNLPIGDVIVRNKPARVESITKQLKNGVDSKQLPKPLAAEIKGKWQFAASQILAAWHWAHSFLKPTPIPGRLCCSDRGSDKSIVALVGHVERQLAKNMNTFGETRPTLVS